MANAYEEPSLDSKESLYESLSHIVSKELPRQSIDPSGGILGSGAFGERKCFISVFGTVYLYLSDIMIHVVAHDFFYLVV